MSEGQGMILAMDGGNRTPTRREPRTLWQSLVDLALPLECGGCSSPGVRWCGSCAEGFAAEPVRLRPRVDPGVPVWSLGTYAGSRRQAVIASKEHGRRDLSSPLGLALAFALSRLRELGELDPPELAPLDLVPAPSRRSAARRRGGDPVRRFVGCAASALAPERVAVAAALQMGRGVRDSVGLGADERRRNLAGRVSLGRTAQIRPGATVVLVDDVVTTGATACESVRVLAAAGVRVHAVLALVHV